MPRSAGKLSDTYGRMLPLLLCPALNAVARGTPPVLGLSKPTLMFGRGTAGGARAAYLMAVNAAIADMVPAEERTAVFGKLGAFVQASFMVGMFSAGEVTKRYSPKVAYIIAASVSLVSFVLMFFGMKETLPLKAPFVAPNPFSFVDLLNPSSIYNKTTSYAGGKLAMVLGLQKGTGEPGLTDAKNLYNRSVVGWDDAQRGNFLAFEGLAMMLANGMTGRVVKAIGPQVNFFGGSLLKMAQYLTMGLTKSGSVLYATLPLAIPLETSQSVTSALYDRSRAPSPRTHSNPSLSLSSPPLPSSPPLHSSPPLPSAALFAAPLYLCSSSPALTHALALALAVLLLHVCCSVPFGLFWFFLCW
eukprot:COSAG06_NODE_8187_length_2245_cov_2.190121_1_plen_358_part_10